ncbi:tripartite tricarboxylate transporter permease [Egibacter rhizosphaerae]|uniref:tripartite tricarboxylate transporter permease n=1 Tax=Egibacter rhizosphaerae TaxID=1670831 RepID=UPI0013F14A12|nr:tripartite tricarboxylate transporter permease [Egibacter rhizosphaerae]
MLEGVLFALQPASLAAALAGVLLGLVFGAIPGLTATLGVALLVPVTFIMEPALGMIMLSGVYAGAIYAGTITGILLRIPGTPASIPSTWEGYALREKGDAELALGTAAVSSGIGGLLSGIVLFTATPPLARFALQFGPAEYAAICVFGLVVVGTMFDRSLLRAGVATFVGLSMGVVGLDPISGYSRFGFGQPDLAGGLSLVPVLIGVFCMPEAFRLARRAVEEHRAGRPMRPPMNRGRLPTFKLFRQNGWNLGRSSAIGIAMGTLPAVGPETTPFVSYSASRRFAKHPEQYGHGSLEGLMATESSNSANVGGSLIPLLALGIPGSAVAAVFVGALTLHGLRPGPLLFTSEPGIMYALFTGFLVVNLFMLLLGVFFVRQFAVVLRIPPHVLAVGVALFSSIGAYAIHTSLFDVWIMLGAALLAAALSSLRIPVAPLVLALILGPLLEDNLRRSLQLSQGDWMIFLQRPISLAFLIFTVVAFTLSRRTRRLPGEVAGAESGTGRHGSRNEPPEQPSR